MKTKSVNITSNSSSSSSSRSFVVGLYTSKNDSKSTNWLDINAFYIKGSAGLFSGVNDYSIASIEIGITSIRFITPKWFGVSGDAIYNPNVYFGVDAVAAGGEVYLEIDWVEFFEDLFNGRFSS